MKYKILLPLLLSACCPALAFSQIVTLQTGATLTYKVVNTVKLPEQDTAVYTAIYEFRLLEKLPDDKLRVRSTLLDYRYKAGDIHFDVGRLNEADINSSDQLFRLMLLNEPVEIILGFDNDFPEQPGLTALLERKTGEWSIKAEYVKAITTGIRYYLQKEARATFFSFPKQPGQLGSRWQSKDSSLLYTIAGNPGGLWHISASHNPAKKQAGYENEYRYNYEWDEKSGRILKADLQSGTSGSSIINGVNKPYHLSEHMQMELLENTGVLPVVSPELMEMSVKASSGSNALNDGPETDSTRLYAFFEKFDPLFRYEKKYIHLKLGLIQQLPGERSHYIYNDSLNAVPNYLLNGASNHLHNKLQTVLAKDADSAMMLIRYLSATRRRSFEDWMQHSYVQHLVRDPKDYNVEEAVAHWRKNGVPEKRIQELISEVKTGPLISARLIREMAHDRDTLIRNAAYPMYLYHTGKALRDKDSVRLIVQQFKSMPDNVIKHGNANRYALMLNKQLMATGYATEAGELLDNAIAKLEKSAGDSTSPRHYTDRNMLAYAYKLKYDALKKTDHKQAFVYLAKASATSPRKQEENTSDSFYDRAMIGSQESYRQDFAEELLKEGATNEALVVLAQQITADPTILPAVQKAFRQHLPEKDFADFFEQLVMKSWKTAPDFELQGTDGQLHKLSDYAGKWLLLDFWGTWCQPCRKELPQINAFANSIKGNAEKAFLSIACYDNVEKVNALFSKEGYTLPVAMSDVKVQENYGVKGYPSKFLVSPQGKMIFLSYGSDWQKIVDHFNSIKPEVGKPGDKKSTVSKDLH